MSEISRASQANDRIQRDRARHDEPLLWVINEDPLSTGVRDYSSAQQVSAYCPSALGNRSVRGDTGLAREDMLLEC